MDKLNAGCGRDYRDGWLNVDVDPDVDVDQRRDLSETPWQWAHDNQFETVLLDNVFEHIRAEDRTAVLEELHRVTASHGAVIMRLPVPEVGVGWDETHPSVPSWRVFHHPRRSHRWNVLSVRGERVGPGRFVPEPVARFATRFWLFRGVSEVEVKARPI